MKPVDVATQTDALMTTFGSDTVVCQPLAQCMEMTVRRYLDDLGQSEPTNLYQLLLTQIEKPLLAVVMEKARGNRCRAADMLGINRNTLRKKLRQYGF